MDDSRSSAEPSYSSASRGCVGSILSLKDTATEVSSLLICDIRASPPADLHMRDELPLRALLVLTKRARDTLRGRALVPGEQVIDIDQCSFLQQRINEIEHRL